MFKARVVYGQGVDHYKSQMEAWIRHRFGDELVLVSEPEEEAADTPTETPDASTETADTLTEAPDASRESPEAPTETPDASTETPETPVHQPKYRRRWDFTNLRASIDLAVQDKDQTSQWVEGGTVPSIEAFFINDATRKGYGIVDVQFVTTKIYPVKVKEKRKEKTVMKSKYSFGVNYYPCNIIGRSRLNLEEVIDAVLARERDDSLQSELLDPGDNIYKAIVIDAVTGWSQGNVTTMLFFDLEFEKERDNTVTGLIGQKYNGTAAHNQQLADKLVYHELTGLGNWMAGLAGLAGQVRQLRDEYDGLNRRLAPSRLLEQVIDVLDEEVRTLEDEGKRAESASLCEQKRRELEQKKAEFSEVEELLAAKKTEWEEMRERMATSLTHDDYIAASERAARKADMLIGGDNNPLRLEPLTVESLVRAYNLQNATAEILRQDWLATNFYQEINIEGGGRPRWSAVEQPAGDREFLETRAAEHRQRGPMTEKNFGRYVAEARRGLHHRNIAFKDEEDNWVDRGQFYRGLKDALDNPDVLAQKIAAGRRAERLKFDFLAQRICKYKRDGRLTTQEASEALDQLMADEFEEVLLHSTFDKLKQKIAGSQNASREPKSPELQAAVDLAYMKTSALVPNFVSSIGRNYRDEQGRFTEAGENRLKHDYEAYTDGPLSKAIPSKRETPDAQAALKGLYDVLYVEFWKKHGDEMPDATVFYNGIYVNGSEVSRPSPDVEDSGQRSAVHEALREDGAEPEKFLKAHICDYTIAVRKYKKSLEHEHGIAPKAVISKAYHRNLLGRAAARLCPKLPVEVSPARFYWVG